MGDLKGKKILVIDDEPDHIAVVSFRLQAAGFETISASDGEKGWDVFLKIKPDLVLLDVMLPRIDGFEFFKLMKSMPARADIPILILTGRTGMRDTFEAMGVDGFITKPYDGNELVSKVQLLLQKRALIVSDDRQFIEKTKETLALCDYTAYTAKDEDDLMVKAAGAKYKAIVVHLAFIKSEPEQFLRIIKKTKNADSALIIYSDWKTKGMESDNLPALQEIKQRWNRVDITKLFYDKRIEDKAFSDPLRTALAQDRARCDPGGQR
ncbi:MAG: response regulator [Candidatus Omnitrophica bacterium]|nr:response regulator [Candidatus Omnitrophota bacterium]